MYIYTPSNMLPKNTITQFLFVLSCASISICHIIRRDAIEETSVAMVTEELSSNEIHPNDLTNTQEDNVEEQEEWTNELLGNFPHEEYQEGHDVDEEEHGVETSSTSPGETTRDITTSRDITSSTVAIETSTSHETPTPTTITEQLHLVDVLTGATSAAPQELSTATLNDDEFSLQSARETCYEPSRQRLHLNFKQSNQNVKFPALAILKKENVEESDQPGNESAVGPQSPMNEYVNMTCPRELLHVSGHDDVSIRSLCPWTYIADVDPNRYPSKIMFAVCRCPECIRPGLSEEDGEFSEDNTCRPVYFRMKVLKKGSCVQGLYMYNTEYQKIPVACACVRPKS